MDGTEACVKKQLYKAYKQRRINSLETCEAEHTKDAGKSNYAVKINFNTPTKKQK